MSAPLSVGAVSAVGATSRRLHSLSVGAASRGGLSNCTDCANWPVDYRGGSVHTLTTPTLTSEDNAELGNTSVGVTKRQSAAVGAVGTLPTRGAPTGRSTYLIHNRAKLDTCSLCVQCTVTAISGGIPVVVDPTPITRRGELVVLAGDRQVFELSRFGGELWQRDRYSMRRPARGLLLPEHRCGQLVDEALREAWPTPIVRATTARCPF